MENAREGRRKGKERRKGIRGEWRSLARGGRVRGGSGRAIDGETVYKGERGRGKEREV